MPQKVNTPQGDIELNVSGVSQARLPVAKKSSSPGRYVLTYPVAKIFIQKLTIFG